MTAPHLAPGQSVAGRHTVQGLLRFTGETATYLARSAAGQDVVLKVYDPAIAQRQDDLAALQRAHSLLAQLPPELVVPVIDSGYDPTTGAPFSASERVAWPSLEQLVRSGGPMPLQAVAGVLASLGRALDAAHGRELSHLALKPTNVFVGPGPGSPVRVGDFGVAAARATNPSREAYTHSAPWWAPEQVQPGAPKGAAADVFAAALLAFFGLTGRSYWRSCQSTPPDLVNWQHELMGPRIPVSHRAAELGVAVPAALDDVFARALAINPAERPQRVSELAAALQAASGGPLPAAAPAPAAVGPAPQSPGAGAHSQAPPGAYPAAAASSANAAAPPKKSSAAPIVIGVVSALVLGGGVVGYLFVQSSPSDSEATAPASPIATAEGSAQAPTAPASAPIESAEAATASSAAASAGEPQADADPEPEKVELTLECVPQCDALLVDNQKIDDLEAKNVVAVLPGKHTVEGRKAGYVTSKETIEIELGKPLEKRIQLVKIPNSPRPAKRDCGQFLRPCK